jgi:hypothetical protein
MKPITKFLLSCLPMAGIAYALSHKDPDPASPAGMERAALATATAEMTAAAVDFLAALEPEKKAKAAFEFKSEERENWRFVPIERKGLQIKEMTPEQRHLAMCLLSSTLSNEGLRKVSQIMSLEKILFDLENQSPKRDPERYFVSIFGTPAAKGLWGWRYEGHHMSFNITLADGEIISVTPTFLGANPGVVKEGPRAGLEVLAEEDSKGIALLKALTPEQQKKATISDTVPNDIFTAESRVAVKLEDAGIPLSELNETQRAAANTLIDEFVRRYRPEIADARKHTLEEDPKNVYFAWIGSPEVGQSHYYRIQGKKFVLEYDNTQNNARHPHAVWRDFKGDFGRDILADHYKGAH